MKSVWKYAPGDVIKIEGKGLLYIVTGTVATIGNVTNPLEIFYQLLHPHWGKCMEHTSIDLHSEKIGENAMWKVLYERETDS